MTLHIFDFVTKFDIHAIDLDIILLFRHADIEEPLAPLCSGDELAKSVVVTDLKLDIVELEMVDIRCFCWCLHDIE